MRDEPMGCLVAEVLSVVVPIALLIIGICIEVSYQTTRDTVAITVAEKSRGSEGSGSDYLVWSTDGECFEVDDAFWYGHFRASDVYGQIEEGETYTVFVIGKRRPFLSDYRRIIRIEE